MASAVFPVCAGTATTFSNGTGGSELVELKGESSGGKGTMNLLFNGGGSLVDDDIVWDE